MYPMIKPALRRGWRDRRAVQYGVAPAHAVVLDPVDTATGSFLDLLDGTRNLAQLRQAAEAIGLGADAADRLMERLARAGLLDDAAAARRAAAQVGDRLRPDLASLSVLHPEPGGAVRRLAARRTARVQVRGGGRVGATLAALLSAAGVGQVDVVDGGCVTACDTAPGGIAAGQTGERRVSAIRKAVRRAAPWSRPPREERGRPGGPARGLGLVVFAPRDGLAAYAPDPAATGELIAAGQPHLYTGVVESTGFVGPLVLPGVSACAECLLRGRAAREPSWPLMVGQWRSARRPGVPACDIALATVVAGAAASYALSFLDGDGTPGAGIRTAFILPGLRREEEVMRPYSECPCGAASPGTVNIPSAEEAPQVTMAS
ncbi:ThiF family adenylyltransferase [Streptomyces gobiensis]|uniref:ThiF family adenylyltransferase n=1 Tax=Streptomyces gobiensis TaxID=2875706 RepID=UPI001E2CFC5E|nr:ThiF family adenylyltransferase [Streptomyces gobiensis]UGY93516.1 ThiF family adenylyltransferase [Streptomyces gobiensis]